MTLECQRDEAQCSGASLWSGGPHRKPAGLPPIWPPRSTPQGLSALRPARSVRVPCPPPMNLLKLSRTTIQTRKSPGFPEVCSFQPNL